MNAFVDWVAFWLADFYLAATVLLAASLGAMAVCRQPAKRLAVAKAAIVALALLAGLCALPGWSLISLEWTWAEATADVSDSRRAIEVAPAELTPVVELGAVAEAAGQALPVIQPGSVATGPNVSWLRVIVTAYLAGCGIVAAWLLAGLVTAWRLVRRAESASIQLGNEFQTADNHGPAWGKLLVSREIDVAVAIGVWEPRVLLPQAWIDSRSADELRAIFAHELAHVRNGDLRWLAASRLLLVWLWAQPLYWWLRRQMRLDQEALADAAAAERTGRREYAEQLVAWAREVSVRPRPLLPASVGLWEGASQLRRRVAVLLDEKLNVLRQCSRSWALASAGIAAAAALTLSLATFEPSIAKSSQGTAVDSAGIRKLPGGIKVRVVAIGEKETPAQPGRWWDAEGTPFDAAPLDVINGSVSLNDDQEERKLIFQVTGASSDATVRWKTVDLVGGGYWGTPVVNGKEDLPGLYSYGFTIKKGLANFGLHVDIANGDWKTVLQSAPTKGNNGTLAGGKTLELGEGFLTPLPYWGDVAAVRLKLNFNDQAVRVIAIDTKGKLRTRGGTIGKILNHHPLLNEIESRFTGIRLADVERFEVQVRDFESVDFAALPTQPDAGRPAVPFALVEADSATTGSHEQKPDVAERAHAENASSTTSPAPNASEADEAGKRDGQVGAVAANELVGAVVDEAGQPVPDVTVDAWTWHPGNETQTDEKGRFRLHGFEPGQRVQVEFRKPGYGPRHFAAIPVGQAEAIVKLDNRTFLEGRVVNGQGDPVAGQLVRVSRGPFKNPEVVIGEVWNETKSDAQGNYRLYLEPDKYNLQARAPGIGLARQEIVLTAGEQRKFDIQLKPGPVFRADIRDSVTDQPVSGIRLWNWQQRGIEGVSDDNGVLVIENMLPGKFEFNVSAAGEKRPNEIAGEYARWWSAAATHPHQRLELDDGSRGPQRNLGFQRNFDDLEFEVKADGEAVKIVVERCVRITGRVVDPDGKPVGGATVAPAKTGSGNSLTGDTRFSVRTADDGSFDLRLPASGAAKYNLVAHDGDYYQWRKWANGVGDLLQTKPGDVIEDVQLKLSTPCVVQGRVLDANGAPVANHQVRAQSADKFESRYYDPTTKTNDQGEFELRFIRPGKHYVQADPFWITAEDAPENTWKLVEVKEGVAVEGVELRLQPDGRPSSLGAVLLEMREKSAEKD